MSPAIDTQRGRKPKPRRRKPVAPAPADVKSEREFGKAERHKQGPAYRAASREAYSAAPVARRQRILANAPAGVERSAAQRVHRARVRRRAEIARSAAQHDVVTDRDLRAARELRSSPQYRALLAAAQKRRPLKRKSSGLNIGLPDLSGVAGKGAEIAVSLLPGGHAARRTGAAKIAGTLTERTARDLRNFPAAAVTGSYYTGRAAVKAAQGDTREAKQLAKDFTQTDPIYNVAAAGVEAATGDTKSAKSHLRKAGKQAWEHPGFTAIEAAGAAGTAGRLAGAGTRTAGRVAPGRVGAAAKRAGSTKREPARVPGTRLTSPRAYSKSLPVAVAQKARERRQVRMADEMRAQADRIAKDKPEAAAELRAKADRGDPRVMTPAQIGARVDEERALSEGIRRSRRATVTRQARQAVKEGRQSPVVALRAQGIVKAEPSDIRAYVGELTEQAKGLTGSRLQANRKLRADLEQALKRPERLPAAEAAAARYRGLVAPAQRELVERGVITRAESEAALTGYAVRRMAARNDPAHYVDADGKRVPEAEVRRVRANDPTTAGKLYTKVPDRFVDARGRELTAPAIRAHMAEAGEPEPAFVSQRPGQSGAGAFFVPSDEPVQVSRQRRTGEATRQGTLRADPEVLVETAARSRGLADAQGAFTRFVQEFAYNGKSGKPRAFGSYRQAQAAARDVEAETQTRVRPVRLAPFLGRSEQLRALLDDVDPEAFETHPQVKDALEGALRGEGEGPVALVPEAAARQLEAHVAQMGGGASKKAIQGLNQVFRRAVLATSPNWIAGNVSEAALRAGLMRAGPRSYITGRRVIKRLERQDPGAAERLAHRATGGGHFSAAESQRLKRSAEQFAGSRLEKPARLMQRVFETPGPKQLADFWHAWTRTVFQHVNGGIERGVQTAMLGKAVREQLLDDRLLKLSNKAMDEAARGARNTTTQVQLARAVRRAYGKYADYSPTQRAWLTLYSPFGAWFVNSVYFVTRTLPADHPTTTALIASAEQLSEEWRTEHGLDIGAQGAVPLWLQGSIPLSGGRHQRAPMKHVPFGLWTDPLGAGRDLVLPQISGVLAAMDGKDWKGDTIWKKDSRTGKSRQLNETERGLEMAKAFGGATIPGLGPGLRVAKQGPSALNPYKPIAPPKDKRRAAAAAVGAGDLDEMDLEELRESAREAAQGLDEVDLGELREAARGAR